MNDIYQSFITTAKELASHHDLYWDPPHGASGKVEKAHRWNLTLLCGLAPPPTIWLSDFGYDANSVKVLNDMRVEQASEHIAVVAMSRDWRELYQAVILNELLVKRNKPQHTINAVGRYVRILAVCAGDTPPWALTPELVQLAYNAALQIGTSGKIAGNLAMVVRNVIDALRLTDHTPLARFCTPYPGQPAEAAEQKVRELRQRANSHWQTSRKRTELAQRKEASKLPEESAFWELVRIVFTEEAKTFSDIIRFSQVRLAIATGFRIGENTMLPVDWERWRDYVDVEDRPAGESGGISKSLMIRHFAEKQVEDEGRDGLILCENAQHVPQMFEEMLSEALSHVSRITAPMRSRLRKQIETGRLFPEFSPEDLVPAWDLYTRVSGSLQFIKTPVPDHLVSQYRACHDPEALEKIREWQLERLHSSGVNKEAGKYWSALSKRSGLQIRDANGNPLPGGRIKWLHAHLKIGEVEEIVRTHMPTKLPDWDAFTLKDGQKLHASELLFLLPVRAIVENRDGGIVDVNRYFAVGRASNADLQLHLGPAKNNLFTRYGETEEDRKHSLQTHSLRHLQTTELFRLGIADTIISKRFNRSSVAQSYEYDHRSLAEDLAHIDLPEGAEKIGPRAQETFRMIRAGRVSGPIVEEFLRIQQNHGDDAAFDYLDAEADGLHVTPYGFCVNSFTLDPCPKHLECFNGCRHLTRSAVPEEQQNLEKLRDRMETVVVKIENQPVSARPIGWGNQLTHARTRLNNIEKILATVPGETAFPDGPDLHRSFRDASGTTILDTSVKIRIDK